MVRKEREGKEANYGKRKRRNDGRKIIINEELLSLEGRKRKHIKWMKVENGKII